MEACSPGLNITQRQRLVTKQSLPFILVLDAHRVEVTHLRLPADRVASPELLAFLFPTSRREGLFYVANFACFWEQRKEENSGPRTPAATGASLQQPPPKVLQRHLAARVVHSSTPPDTQRLSSLCVGRSLGWGRGWRWRVGG